MPDQDWHAAAGEAVLDEQRTSRDGLSAEEADRRRERHGPNTLERADAVSPLRIFLHQFTSPLIYVLVVAFLVTVAIEHYADAIVIALVLAINAVVGFVQEYRAENAMVALAVHVGVMHFGPTRAVLNVEPIALETWLRILLVAPPVLVVAEPHKYVRGRTADEDGTADGHGV